MSRSLRTTATLLLGSLSMLGAPLALGTTASLLLAGSAAIAAPNGHASGKAGGNGGGSGKSENGQGHSGGNGGGNSQAGAGKTKVASVGADLDGNLHAQLGGLNSLNRNINGLMNSADPRMDGIRAYIEASATLELAQQALAAAQTTLTGAQGAYDALFTSLGLDTYAYADTSPSALQTRLAELAILVLTDPTLQTEIDALTTLLGSTELTTLQTAQLDFDTAQQTATDALVGTTDTDLIEALLVAANDNRVAQYGDGYVTPELLDWAKSVLGTGDYQGAIDAYLAQ